MVNNPFVEFRLTHIVGFCEKFRATGDLSLKNRF